MNTVGSTTVDIKKTLLHYIKAEFKEKDLDMLKSLLGSIYKELTNTPDILPHLESPNLQLILWIAVTEQILIPLLTRPLSLQII